MLDQPGGQIPYRSLVYGTAPYCSVGQSPSCLHRGDVRPSQGSNNSELPYFLI